MAQEEKKVVRIVCSENNNFEVHTRMPLKILAAEIEGYEVADFVPDPKWCRLEGVNQLDEPTPTSILRSDIRGYMVIPWHAQLPQQPQRPGLVQ